MKRTPGQALIEAGEGVAASPGRTAAAGAVMVLAAALAGLPVFVVIALWISRAG